MPDALERSDKQEDARLANRDPFKVWKSRRKKRVRVLFVSEPDFFELLLCLDRDF
jgi:hypothetical protein